MRRRGNNNLIGTAGGDTIYGLGGNDTISGNGGNDMIDGGTGHDGIDGGAGDDTAVFSGNLVSYTLQDRGVGGVTVVGPDGSDTLSGVEHLRFADGTIHLNDGNALFDTTYYDRNSLDVFQAGIERAAHYNASAGGRPRPQCGSFDSSWYLAINPDVRACGANPLEHYPPTGWREGRDPRPNFDTEAYLLNNPDVAASGSDPLEHFLQFGRAEGRAASQALGPTLPASTRSTTCCNTPTWPLPASTRCSTSTLFGWREGRNPNALFDTAATFRITPTCAAPASTRCSTTRLYGWLEGRDPSAASTRCITRGLSRRRCRPRQPARPLPQHRHPRGPHAASTTASGTDKRRALLERHPAVCAR